MTNGCFELARYVAGFLCLVALGGLLIWLAQQSGQPEQHAEITNTVACALPGSDWGAIVAITGLAIALVTTIIRVVTR